MTDKAEIEKNFWKALKDDKIVMLMLPDEAGGLGQPMTAMFEDERGPIWIFTSSEAELFQAMGPGHDALIHFADKGHDLFATLTGRLVPDQNREVIDRLWNSHVAAWFEGGKEDPAMRLVRFEPESAQIWLNDDSLFAGMKLLFGADPKEDAEDKVAQVRMN
jgi:general stress protein 26